MSLSLEGIGEFFSSYRRGRVGGRREERRRREEKRFGFDATADPCFVLLPLQIHPHRGLAETRSESIRCSQRNRYASFSLSPTPSSLRLTSSLSSSQSTFTPTSSPPFSFSSPSPTSSTRHLSPPPHHQQPSIPLFSSSFSSQRSRFVSSYSPFFDATRL